MGRVELLKHQGVALEVGALADDQALDAEVAEGPGAIVVAEVGLVEVQMLDLAVVVEVDPGDVDVDVLRDRGPSFLATLLRTRWKSR